MLQRQQCRAAPSFPRSIVDALGLEIRNVTPRRARPVVGEESLEESEWETRDAELKRHVHAESIVDRTSLPKKGSVVAATYDCHGGGRFFGISLVLF